MVIVRPYQQELVNRTIVSMCFGGAPCLVPPSGSGRPSSQCTYPAELLSVNPQPNPLWMVSSVDMKRV
jgi:hypothetical protein